MDSLNRYYLKCCKVCQNPNNPSCYEYSRLKEIMLQNDWPKERAIADHRVSCYYCKKVKVECEKLQVDIEK